MHNRKRSGIRLGAEHQHWTKYSRVYKAPAAAILRKLDFMDAIVKLCSQSRPFIGIHFPTCISH